MDLVPWGFAVITIGPKIYIVRGNLHILMFRWTLLRRFSLLFELSIYKLKTLF